MPNRPTQTGCTCCIIPAALVVAALIGASLFAARWIMAAL